MRTKARKAIFENNIKKYKYVIRSHGVLGFGLEASLEVFDPSGLYSSLPSVTFSLGLFLGENPEGFLTETLGHSEGAWP